MKDKNRKQFVWIAGGSAVALILFMRRNDNDFYAILASAVLTFLLLPLVYLLAKKEIIHSKALYYLSLTLVAMLGILVYGAMSPLVSSVSWVGWLSLSIIAAFLATSPLVLVKGLREQHLEPWNQD